jgi:hypothetical protein
MTGCRWPDNKKSRIIEDDPKTDLLMSPYVYVKNISRITSYSTLFILKRNTVTVFTFRRTYVSQEYFLKKSVRTHCLEPRAFVYSLAHLPFYFRVSIYERLPAYNSARARKVERNCIPVWGTVNRSPDREILLHIYTGRFIMSSVITNTYNKKTKGSTVMELFTATGELEAFLTRDVRCVHHGWHGTHRYDIQVLATHASTWIHRYSSLPRDLADLKARIIAACCMLTRVWQELEYRIDVCRATRGAYIEHL